MIHFSFFQFTAVISTDGDRYEINLDIGIRKNPTITDLINPNFIFRNCCEIR